MNSEQKMREALEHIAVLADKYSGEYPTQVGAIAREALAAPAGEQVGLTDKRVKVKLVGQYGTYLYGHWFYLQPADEFAEAALSAHADYIMLIAAHEAKRNGGGA